MEMRVRMATRIHLSLLLVNPKRKRRKTASRIWRRKCSTETKSKIQTAKTVRILSRHSSLRGAWMLAWTRVIWSEWTSFSTGWSSLFQFFFCICLQPVPCPIFSVPVVMDSLRKDLLDGTWRCMSMFSVTAIRNIVLDTIDVRMASMKSSNVHEALHGMKWPVHVHGSNKSIAKRRN